MMQGDTTGTGAAGTACSWVLQLHITLTDQGLGYRNIPVVLDTTGYDDPTTPCCCNTSFDEQEGRIGSIVLDTPGVGYETAPTITITGGAGTGVSIDIDIQSLTGICHCIWIWIYCRNILKRSIYYYW